MDFCTSFPREIVEIIFGYLSLDELLSVSLVSKTWMHFIGNSEVFKKKSAINVDQWNWNVNKITEIEKSYRHYETLRIKLFACKDKDKSRLQRLLECKNWKRIFFNVSKISNQKAFVKFINVLQTARELQVMNVQIKELKNHNKIVLKELESLALSEIAIDTLYTFMAHQPQLKKLSLRFISSDILSNERSGQVIANFLKLNNSIRELELNEDVTNDLFVNDLTQEIKLCLKTLMIGLYNSSETVQNNVSAFLKSQGSSLEQFEMIFKEKFQIQRNSNWWMIDDDVEGADNERNNDFIILFNSWDSLVNLKELSLRFMSDRSTGIDIKPDAYKYLKPNYSIKSLYIRHIDCPQMKMNYISVILNLCPNLEFLYVSVINPSLIRFAMYNFKCLRNVLYIKECDDALNVYDELKSKNEEGINKFIKFSLQYRG